jgi:hypothetical protein
VAPRSPATDRVLRLHQLVGTHVYHIQDARTEVAGKQIMVLRIDGEVIEALAFRTQSTLKLVGNHCCRALSTLAMEVPSLAFMDDFERIPVWVKYIGGVVSRIVFHSCPR